MLLPATCALLGLGAGILIGQANSPVRYQSDLLLWTAWGTLGIGFVGAVTMSVLTA